MAPWLNEKAVILREQFVKPIPGSRPLLPWAPSSRKILEVILRREGHQVACFGDPLEALRFLSRCGPADLLSLGLEMNGFDVLKYLRGESHFHSMLRVALLSKQDGILVRLKARLAGAQQVVRKPLVRRQIVALVSEYLDRGTALQEADQRAGWRSLRDDETALYPGRSGSDGTANSRNK